jgi:hypothetical protein
MTVEQDPHAIVHGAKTQAEPVGGGVEHAVKPSGMCNVRSNSPANSTNVTRGLGSNRGVTSYFHIYDMQSTSPTRQTINA